MNTRKMELCRKIAVDSPRKRWYSVVDVGKAHTRLCEID